LIWTQSGNNINKSW